MVTASDMQACNVRLQTVNTNHHAYGLQVEIKRAVKKEEMAGGGSSGGGYGGGYGGVLLRPGWSNITPFCAFFIPIAHALKVS